MTDLIGSAPSDPAPPPEGLAGCHSADKIASPLTQLAYTGLPFVHADDLATCLNPDAYDVAEEPDSVRRSLLQQWASYVVEKVICGPAGDKRVVWGQADATGWQVVWIFTTIAYTATSTNRVAVRPSAG